MALHAPDHLHLDAVLIAAVIHARQQGGEVLATRSLAAAGEPQQIKVGLVAGAQDDANVTVAADAKLEAHAHILIAQVPREREVMALDRVTIKAQCFLRHTDAAFIEIMPVAVDEMPLAVCDTNGLRCQVVHGLGHPVRGVQPALVVRAWVLKSQS